MELMEKYPNVMTEVNGTQEEYSDEDMYELLIDLIEDVLGSGAIEGLNTYEDVIGSTALSTVEDRLGYGRGDNVMVELLEDNAYDTLQYGLDY